MSISVSKNSVAFGSVATQNTVQQELTVTNSSNHAVDVTISIEGAAPGLFTVSPSSQVTVPASSTLSGTLTLAVFFQPAAIQSYSATLRIRADGAPPTLVPLTGTGTAPQGWQQQAGSYLLVKVPDYGDGTFEAADAPKEQVTMTSYLRLGTFDWGQESPLAKELIKVISQVGTLGNPKRGDQVHYPDFDYDTVATFDDLPPVKVVAQNKNAGDTGNREVFFLDDVRTRAQDCDPPLADPGHGLSRAQRQRESARLYNRGGWRDHSDGNRLSTTYGDKVEVIRGNYKMIVLGRNDDPGAAMGWEASGDHIMDFAPGTMPGAAYWLEWIPDYKIAADPTVAGDTGTPGVWLLVNSTENVYQFERNAGHFREEKWGDLDVTFVGSENPPSPTAPATTRPQVANIQKDERPPSSDPAKPLDPWVDPGTQGHDIPQAVRLSDVQYELPTPLVPKAGTEKAKKVRSNPHIVEKTWARRIDTWTGSEALRIPVISEETWADKTFGTTMVNESTEHTGSSSSRVTKKVEWTWAVDTEEHEDITNKSMANKVAGAIFEATTAGTIWETTTTALHMELEASNHVELELGIGHAEFNLGFHFALEIAGSLEITLGAGYEIKLGPHEEFKTRTQRLALSRATASLERTATVLKDSTVSVDLKTTALAHALTALKVNLGV